MDNEEWGPKGGINSKDYSSLPLEGYSLTGPQTVLITKGKYAGWKAYLTAPLSILREQALKLTRIVKRGGE